MRWLRLVALAGLVAGVLVVSKGAQGQSGADAEPVYLAVSVVDSAGHLVTGLGRDDVQVSLGAVARPLTVFMGDPLPFAVTFVFDLSGSLARHQRRMRDAMATLLSKFRPGDRGMVVAFAGSVVMSPRFTAHPPTLLAQMNAGLSGMPCASPRAQDESNVWDAMMCAIERTAADSETPRRIVVLVSDGVDNASATPRAWVTRLADRYGITIYSIGLRGTDGLDSGALRSLAEAAGGGYFELKSADNLGETFNRVADELRQHYVLGFMASVGELNLPLAVIVRDRVVTVSTRRVTLPVFPAVTW